MDAIGSQLKVPLSTVAATTLLLAHPGALAQTAGHDGADFAMEIASPATMRKATTRMIFSPRDTGPTLIDWKTARDLKLGTDNGMVFHPTHSSQVKHKRRTIALDQYGSLAGILPVGPPSGKGPGAKKKRVELTLFVFEPELPFRLTGTDAQGRQRTVHLKEVCVPADARGEDVPQCIAGPEFARGVHAALVTSGKTTHVLWDQKAPTNGSTLKPRQPHK